MYGATSSILYSKKGMKLNLLLQSKRDRGSQWVSKCKSYGVKKSGEMIEMAKQN